MARQKSRAELQAELRAVRQYRTVDVIGSVLRDVIRWGAVCLCGYWMYRSVAVLAGRVTLADIGIRVLGSLRVSEALAWILGVGGVGYGARQRRLRRDTVERLSSRIQILERAIDPKRTSSKLTPRGETPPEDG